MVNYTEDDSDMVGDFFQIQSGNVIARYVMDFTTNLESDITPTGVLDDIEGEIISIIGKDYTITSATNDSDGDVTMVLMSGANQGTIQNGEEITIGGYTVSAIVSGSNAVLFTINGQTIDTMSEGEMEPIPGTNEYIAVTNIIYEGFQGGVKQATFFIGADKIELINNTNMKVNGESVDARVQISMYESGSVISITEISVNMTADDDVYVPVNGKLSEVIEADGDDPEVLLTQNWDIEFKGYEQGAEETIKLVFSEGDTQLDLTFENYLGSEVVLPLFYTNNSGIFGGDSADKELHLVANYSGKNITKNDYFILNTGDPTSANSNSKTLH